MSLGRLKSPEEVDGRGTLVGVADRPELEALAEGAWVADEDGVSGLKRSVNASNRLLVLLEEDAPGVEVDAALVVLASAVDDSGDAGGVPELGEPVELESPKKLLKSSRSPPSVDDAVGVTDEPDAAEEASLESDAELVALTESVELVSPKKLFTSSRKLPSVDSGVGVTDALEGAEGACWESDEGAGLESDVVLLASVESVELLTPKKLLTSSRMPPSLDSAAGDDDEEEAAGASGPSLFVVGARCVVESLGAASFSDGAGRVSLWDVGAAGGAPGPTMVTTLVVAEAMVAPAGRGPEMVWVLPSLSMDRVTTTAGRVVSVGGGGGGLAPVVLVPRPAFSRKSSSGFPSSDLW